MNFKAYPVGVHINENSVKMLDGIVQNDNGNLFQIQLYSGSDAYDFSGYMIVNATIIRPDETTISDIWTAEEHTQTIEQQTEVTPGEDEEEPIAWTADDETEGGDSSSSSSTTTTVTTGTTTEGSHTFLAIQYIDPENGRITLKVGGDATAQVGLHRMALEIYSDDARVTTARINYRVVETLNNVDHSILDNNESYVELQSLLAQCSNILNEETERVNQEEARNTSEQQRADTFASLSGQMQSELDYARALFNEAIASGQMDDLYEYTTNYIDTNLGRIPTTDNAVAWFTTHQSPGLMVYCTADQLVYVGTGSGNYRTLITYAPYVAGTSAPSDTRQLWIDTSQGSIVKYYNGSTWVRTGAIALFA